MKKSAAKSNAGKSGKDIIRALIDTEKDAVFILDRDNIIACNHNSLKLFGLTRRRLIDIPLHAFSPEYQPDGEESKGKMLRKLSAALDGEKQNFLWNFSRRDGKSFHTNVIFDLIQADGKDFIKAIVYDTGEQDQSLELYKLIAHNSPLGIYIGRDGKFVFVNTMFRNCAGYGEQELIDRDSLSLVHPEDRDMVRAFAVQMLKRERTAPFEFRVVTKSGEIKWIMGSVIPLFFNNKREVLGNFMEITDHKRAEEVLREGEERYRAILENIEDGYYEVDLEKRFTFYNSSCQRIFGCSKEEMMGNSCRDHTDKENWESIQKVFSKVYETGIADTIPDWLIIRKDGFKRHIEASLTAIHDHAGSITGIRGIMRDITERKKTEESVAFLAYHDSLTGLPNRVLFNDRLSMTLTQSRRNNQKFGLMMLDLDKFKDINDTLGHHIGDQLLQGVGIRLRSRLRKGDTVARMGGDEFMLLLTDVKEAEACMTIAGKIVESFQRPFLLDDHEVHVTTSVGIAIYPDDGQDFDALKKHADASMYKAKAMGRNNYQRNMRNNLLETANTSKHCR